MEMLSSPGKKRMKNKTTKKKKKPSTTQNPSLPDDLILSIIARVSRLYYPTLSLVSKSFRSLLTSPELYKTRSLLGHTESCLYVCFKTYDPCSIWFTLCRKPDQTLTNDDKKKSGYVLAKVPIPHSPDADFSGIVAVGSNIYNIGKSPFKASSSTVFVLDCMTHTWREAPRLPEELFSVSANVLDGKIYVAGRSAISTNGDNDSRPLKKNSFEVLDTRTIGWDPNGDGDNDSRPLKKNSFEVFDTRTQVWDPNPIPCIVAKDKSFYKSACLNGKFHVMAESEVAAYNAKEGRWDLVRSAMSGYGFSDSHCVIDNVLYCFSYGAFRWYDSQVGFWKDLKGLVGLPRFPSDDYVRLADYDGKMAVFWTKFCYYDKYKKKIWYAEIALERRRSGEIWGKVEWFDHVLTMPTSDSLEKAVAATF